MRHQFNHTNRSLKNGEFHTFTHLLKAIVDGKGIEELDPIDGWSTAPMQIELDRAPSAYRIAAEPWVPREIDIEKELWVELDPEAALGFHYWTKRPNGRAGREFNLYHVVISLIEVQP